MRAPGPTLGAPEVISISRALPLLPSATAGATSAEAVASAAPVHRGANVLPLLILPSDSTRIDAEWSA